MSTLEMLPVANAKVQCLWDTEKALVFSSFLVFFVLNESNVILKVKPLWLNKYFYFTVHHLPIVYYFN